MSRPITHFFILPISIFLLILPHTGMASCTWTWYRDSDGDGFGNPYISTTTACGAAAPVGYVPNNLDANDAVISNPVWYGAINQVLSTEAVAPEITFSADSTPYTMIAKIATNKLSVLKMVSGGWNLVGAEDFSSVLGNMTSASLALDHNTPYVSYADISGALIVMRYDGTSWQTVGSTGTSSVTSTNIAIYNGEPYVIYKSGSNLYALKYSSGLWVRVGAGIVGVGDYPKIAIDSNGVAYVAFSDGDSGIGGKLTVKKFDSTLLTWVYLGSQGFSTDYVDPGPDIVLDGNNILYVSYYDGGLDEVRVKQYASGSNTWINVGDVVYSGQPSDLSFAVDYWGNPYVAYSYSAGTQSNYVVKKIVSNHWTALGPDPITRSTGLPVNGFSISIAVTSGGVPYISFVDNNSSSYISTLELQDSSSPLPITLVYFKGSAKDDKVRLIWSTTSEKNFDYFLLERSSDGRNFASMDKVSGTNKSIQIEYSYEDNYPEMGINYYRLKSIDLDGSYEYSKVIAVEIKPSPLGLFKLYPNPNYGGYVHIMLGADPAPGDYVQIINMMGNMVYTAQIREITLEIVFNNRLASGQYIVNYFSKEQQFSSRMVVVQ